MEEKVAEVTDGLLKLKDKRGKERKVRAIKNVKGKTRELITEESIEFGKTIKSREFSATIVE